MDITYVVLLILAIIYVPIWFWVWRNPEKAAKVHLVKYGPLVMIKTHLGIKTMDKLAKYRRFWRVFGFVSKLLAAVLFFIMMYMLVMSILALPSRIGTGGIGIQYALAIPGFNPMLPLTYGILALFIAMVVHEMAHGIQSRANDCKVDSTGLLYGVVPWGAFCEPNEEQLVKLPRRPQMDIYSAGISINTFVAAISIVAMLMLCSTIVPADYGQGEGEEDLPGVYYIDDGSPAFLSGIPTSALITGIKEANATDYSPVWAESYTKTVSLGSDVEISPLRTYNLRYVTSDGSVNYSDPMQIGALIKTVSNNSPASKAGLEPMTYLYSFSIDGKETLITGSCDFLEYMSATSPGDLITITTATVADGGEIETVVHEGVYLTSSGAQGYLGISVTNSGFTMTTPSMMMETATDPFRGCTDPFSYVKALLSYLSGPINGLDPIPDSITWWYNAPAGDLTWVAIKSAYWIFWLDLLLAISNALPAYPFDGGFLFEGGINWLLERLGIKDDERRKKLSGSISGSISTVTLMMFFLVILALII